MTRPITRLVLGATLACGLAAMPVQAAPLFIQFDNEAGVTDGGLGDLDPTDGIIRFDMLIDYGFERGAVHYEGRVLYLPGTPYIGNKGKPGISGFGVSLTDFIADSVRAPTLPRNQMMVFVQGNFNLGIAEEDLGYVVDHLDGFVTIRKDVERVTFEDLATWAGDGPVSAGHVVAVPNPHPLLEETRVQFDFGDVTSPLSSGLRPNEVVTWQLNLPFMGVTANRFELPGSGIAKVFPVPEPSTWLLMGAGVFALIGWRARQRGA